MNLNQIRDNSIEEAKQLGVDIPSTLPLLDEGLKVRSASEIISRLLAMNTVAAAAYGFDKIKATTWLQQEGLSGSLSEEERRFLFEDVGQSEKFKVQIEGMWVLAWALGFVNELNFAKDCDSNFVKTLPNLKLNQKSTGFREKTNLRPIEQIISACDLVYCLHWAIRQSEIDKLHPPKILQSRIIVERRRALEWLLSSTAWDQIQLDT